jgi:hypothetical protein
MLHPCYNYGITASRYRSTFRNTADLAKAVDAQYLSSTRTRSHASSMPPSPHTLRSTPAKDTQNTSRNSCVRCASRLQHKNATRTTCWQQLKAYFCHKIHNHLTAVLRPSSTPSTPNQRLHSHSEQHAASPRNTARVPRPPPTQLGGVGEHRPRESDGTDHLDHASAAYDVIRGCEDTSSPKRRRVPGTSGGRNRGANCLVVGERDGGDGWDYATHSF